MDKVLKQATLVYGVRRQDGSRPWVRLWGGFWQLVRFCFLFWALVPGCVHFVEIPNCSRFVHCSVHKLNFNKQFYQQYVLAGFIHLQLYSRSICHHSPPIVRAISYQLFGEKILTPLSILRHLGFRSIDNQRNGILCLKHLIGKRVCGVLLPWPMTLPLARLFIHLLQTHPSSLRSSSGSSLRGRAQ